MLQGNNLQQQTKQKWTYQLRFVNFLMALKVLRTTLSFGIIIKVSCDERHKSGIVVLMRNLNDSLDLLISYLYCWSTSKVSQFYSRIWNIFELELISILYINVPSIHVENHTNIKHKFLMLSFIEIVMVLYLIYRACSNLMSTWNRWPITKKK